MTIFCGKQLKIGIKQALSEIIAFMGRFKKKWVLYWFYWFYWFGGRPARSCTPSGQIHVKLHPTWVPSKMLCTPKLACARQSHQKKLACTPKIFLKTATLCRLENKYSTVTLFSTTWILHKKPVDGTLWRKFSDYFYRKRHFSMIYGICYALFLINIAPNHAFFWKQGFLDGLGRL